MTGSGNILKQISKTAKQSEQVINCISHSKCPSGLDFCSLLLILQKNSYATSFLMLFLLLLGAEFLGAVDFKQWFLQPDSMAWPIRNSSRVHSIEIICRDKSRYSYQTCVATSSRKTHPPARRQISSPLQTWRNKNASRLIICRSLSNMHVILLLFAPVPPPFLSSSNYFSFLACWTQISFPLYCNYTKPHHGFIMCLIQCDDMKTRTSFTIAIQHQIISTTGRQRNT